MAAGVQRGRGARGQAHDSTQRRRVLLRRGRRGYERRSQIARLGSRRGGRCAATRQKASTLRASIVTVSGHDDEVAVRGDGELAKLGRGNQLIPSRHWAERGMAAASTVAHRRAGAQAPPWKK